MKRSCTLERVVAEPEPIAVRQPTAKVLTMRAGVSGGCTLCGSTTRVPHKNGHECILALDEEIAALVQRTHTLRKYRAHLMANRAQLYRDILKRSSGRIKTVPTRETRVMAAATTIGRTFFVPARIPFNARWRTSC